MSPGVTTQLRAVVEAARPGNSAMAAVAVVVGGLVVPAFETGDTTPLAIAAAVAGAVTAGGNVVNDVFDVEIDAVNRPLRPIPSGRLPLRTGTAVSAALLSAALLGALVNGFVLAIAALNAIVLVLYSWRLKGVPLAGNAAVSYLVGSTFLFGGSAVGGPTESLPLFLLAFLATLGREVAKDVEDLPGDRGKVSTLATWMGPVEASRVAAALLLAAAASSPVPYLVGVIEAWYLPFAAAADLVLFASAWILVSEPGVSSAASAQRLVKLAMALALAGFVAGAL